MDGMSLQWTAAAAGIRGQVTFTETFAGFQGHFPGRPILPGFCHIDACLEILRRAGRPGNLRRIESARFFAPILPGEIVEVLLTQAEEAWDATLVVNENLRSRFRLWLDTASP